jgi:hypothetical protein
MMPGETALPAHQRAARDPFVHRLAAPLLALATAGCAVSYVDAAGTMHAIGLVDVSSRPPGDPRTLAGDVVEITSLGVSFGSTAQGGFLTIGYSRSATAALRDNALVLGNPVTALNAPAPQQKQKAAP